MRKAVAVLAAVLVLACCARPDNKPDDKEIEDAILKYDMLLAEGYKKLDMAPLREAATERQAEKEYTHMAALGEAGVRLEAELESIEFSEVKVSGLNAEALTLEAWDYTHVKIDTGAAVRRESVRYSLRYGLVKRSGRWLVDDIAELGPEEETLGSDRPRQAFSNAR